MGSRTCDVFTPPYHTSTSTSTSAHSSPSPNPFFLFDIFWLFAVLRNQVIFRKLEEQETRTLCRVHSISLCTSLHTITPFFLLRLLIFFYSLLQFPIARKMVLWKPRRPPTLKLFNHIFRILMEPFTVDNTLQHLQHPPYLNGQKLAQHSSRNLTSVLY